MQCKSKVCDPDPSSYGCINYLARQEYFDFKARFAILIKDKGNAGFVFRMVDEFTHYRLELNHSSAKVFKVFKGKPK